MDSEQLINSFDNILPAYLLDSYFLFLVLLLCKINVLHMFIYGGVTVLLYRRKTRKRVCEILTHHDPTGSSMCENYMSLLFIVKA